MHTVRGLARSQHRVVLWRPLILDRAAVYPLAHLAHGVPWCAVTCLPWTDKAGILTLRTCPPTQIAYWCERPELFAAIADGKTEIDRFLAVLKWFIVRFRNGLIRFVSANMSDPEYVEGAIHDSK